MTNPDLFQHSLKPSHISGAFVLSSGSVMSFFLFDEAKTTHAILDMTTTWLFYDVCLFLLFCYSLGQSLSPFLRLYHSYNISSALKADSNDRLYATIVSSEASSLSSFKILLGATFPHGNSCSIPFTPGANRL